VCRKLITISRERKIVLEMYEPVKERRTLKNNNNNKPGDKGGRYSKITKCLRLRWYGHVERMPKINSSQTNCNSSPGRNKKKRTTKQKKRR
jgi:hypothetical protein